MTTRQMVELNRTEAMRLPGSIPIGRIVCTEHALPAIRPGFVLADVTSGGDRIGSQR